jgi:hypothetical protein
LLGVREIPSLKSIRLMEKSKKKEPMVKTIEKLRVKQKKEQ